MYFTNPNMLNTVSHRLATSNMPGILNASSNGIDNSYRNIPEYNGSHMTSADKQHIFEQRINDLLFGGSVKNINSAIASDSINDRQMRGINVLNDKTVVDNTREKQTNTLLSYLPQRTMVSSIHDPSIMNVSNCASNCMNNGINNMNAPINNSMNNTIPNSGLIAQQSIPQNEDIPNFDQIYSTEKFTERFSGKVGEVFNNGCGTIMIIVIIALAFYFIIQTHISQKRLEMLLMCKQCTDYYNNYDRKSGL